MSQEIITDDLFRSILIEPYQRGGNHLKVLTGYATAAMAKRHLIKADEILESDTRRTANPLAVDVVYGMAHRDGVPLTQHDEFVNMSTQSYGGRFSCHYVVEWPSVHAKTFVWFRDGAPVEAFLGSANYTQTALTGQQIEVLTKCDPDEAATLFEEHRSRSLECQHADVDSSITLFQPRGNVQAGLESRTLSLLDSRTGETPERSGINWGQREGRDPNQAYLSVPQEIVRSGFFPPRTVEFTMNPDFGPSMLCVAAQDDAKAIHSRPSNAILGKYLRARLGLFNGEYVTKSHLDNYGRTDVTIYKEDDETYHLDFSVSD